MAEAVSDYLMFAWDYLLLLDIDYLSWVVWVTAPFLLAFLLPVFILIFLYASAVFLFIFQYRERLREAYQHTVYDGARQTLAAWWNAQGKIWHGYEIRGLEKIPSSGPALIIYYHGAIPVDFYYVMANCLLEKGRLIHAVGDRFLFKVPGFRRLMELLNVTAANVQECRDILMKGNLLAIAPGGVREALFGDENYSVIWGKRMGFARAAIAANAPIIPMFTENCREVFRTPLFGRKLLFRLYEWSRLPIVPVYGFFPVKLITHFGDPIYPKQGMTAEDLRDKVKAKVEDLISCHQQRPGIIMKALWQRFKPKRH